MIIYKATNKINNKVYIGQTNKSLEYRKSQHLREAKLETIGRRRNIYFHNALIKYGFDNFYWEIIEDNIISQDILDNMERYWISYYNSIDRNNGYNIDSGGKTGGVKSNETKIKIGLTSKLKWKDPEISKKMRDGLKKGTEKWIDICKSKRISWTCPVCGKTKLYTACELKNRKTCSLSCASKLPRNEELLKELSIKKHLNNIKIKEELKIKILDWVNKNKNLVINCPYNKIRIVIEPLLKHIDVHDVRSIFICFNVKSRKELLSYFKNYLSI